MLNYKYIYFHNILVRIVKFEFINLYLIGCSLGKIRVGIGSKGVP